MIRDFGQHGLRVGDGQLFFFVFFFFFFLGGGGGVGIFRKLRILKP